MSMTHKLQQHARRILAYSSRTRFFCSSTNKTLSSPARNLTLQGRIEAALEKKAEITTVLEQWRQQQEQGKQLNPSLVRGVVENLRDSQRFREALEVSNWMIVQKICNLIPEDFTTRFHLIENVFGLEEAGNFVESIPENLRNESIYNSLLSSYVRRNDLDRAESTFKKMRELGLLLRASPYNSMTSLYRRIPHGNRCKVDEILREMKESNIKLDRDTVNNALRVYADVTHIATMEKFLAEWEGTTPLEWLTRLDMAKAYLRSGFKGKAREMLRKTEELRDPKSYEELMRLYGEAGGRKDVYRVWDLYKKLSKKDNEGFRALIGSLLKLDDINGAEEFYYKEWECSGLPFDVRIPTMLVSSYREKGMVERADKLMKEIMIKEESFKPITPLLESLERKGNVVKPSELRDLIKNLCDSNQFSKALEASIWMSRKTSFNLFPQDYAARLHMIENVLGFEEAEKFFERSIPENMKDYSVYATLLSCYAKSHKTLDKAEAIFEKMRDLGFLSKPSPFNLMISLYSQLGKREKVDNLISKMKCMNIEPDSLTMNNVLRMYADETDIKTMDKYKSEWVNAELTTKLEMRTMVAMANAYERAGLLLKAIEITRSKNEVRRLWNEYKEKEKRNYKIDDANPCRRISVVGDEEYQSVISSLLKLDDLKGAEEIYGEWEPQGPEFDTRIPCLIISRYCKEGDEVKVREVVYSSIKKRKLMQFERFKEDVYAFGAICIVCVGFGGVLFMIITL
ncbi:Pentatricopeptide repeat [Arabidopsis thaliana x Arabidopsis arenosa]|uniref:Pentatricopeptide repeat n=1 Tax=Arabidopsis thaliana x Arabidopsis arenosa TaxID=1240361 RepID=A0A8T2AZQ9_9BRAS|nr:Pentatricopeptide repeat [Arabidopsis thaliana x Arabidopsis arenosa]